MVDEVATSVDGNHADAHQLKQRRLSALNVVDKNLDDHRRRSTLCETVPLVTFHQQLEVTCSFNQKKQQFKDKLYFIS